ncbi:MAG: SDR family NAD(P)-dependent oxidoreductase [Deltaproteobacteria bacterium]|nr:SDR family NAD(P)-dependent oxidoreductase [Deltaproteobacteria bacterium]
MNESTWQKRFLQRYGAWAVVTGASDGIGEQFARELAAAGVNLVLVARRAPRLEELANDLASAHQVQARVLAVDLAEARGRDAIMNMTRQLDVGLLVAAAGFGGSGLLVNADLQDEIRMIEVNCIAVLDLVRRMGQRLAARGRGGIVLMSSLVGFQGTPYAANYAATKAYVQSLAEGLHVEMRPLGVDVLASAPGPVTSGFAARANMSMGKAPDPKTVARATLRALGHRTTVRPGVLSKLLGYSLSALPRFGRVQIMKLVMGGMTKHHPRGLAAASARAVMTETDADVASRHH